MNLEKQRKKEIDEIVKEIEREIAENPQKLLDESISLEDFEKIIRAKLS